MIPISLHCTTVRQENHPIPKGDKVALDTEIHVAWIVLPAVHAIMLMGSGAITTSHQMLTVDANGKTNLLDPARHVECTFSRCEISLSRQSSIQHHFHSQLHIEPMHTKSLRKISYSLAKSRNAHIKSHAPCPSPVTLSVYWLPQ